MEKARCNTELYSNLRGPLNNVKPSNFWGSHHDGDRPLIFSYMFYSVECECVKWGGAISFVIVDNNF